MSDTQHFEIYLAALRKGSLFAPGLSITQITEWERDRSRKPLIDRAKAEWKERSDRINAPVIGIPLPALAPQTSVIATSKLIKAGKCKLPRPSKALPANDDPSAIVFNSKIVSKLKRDIRSNRLSTEATLAAMNLPGWADAIARYARAAGKPRHKATAKAFFIELGKALETDRRLWDAINEVIATNYYATERFQVPLCEMTESEASKVVNLTLAAYDRRLLRLGIRKDRVGRPTKRDKKSQ